MTRLLSVFAAVAVALMVAACDSGLPIAGGSRLESINYVSSNFPTPVWKEGDDLPATSDLKLLSSEHVGGVVASLLRNEGNRPHLIFSDQGTHFIACYYDSTGKFMQAKVAVRQGPEELEEAQRRGAILSQKGVGRDMIGIEFLDGRTAGCDP